MAIKEKRVVQEVLVCDYCDLDIAKDQNTHVTGNAVGYMKRDSVEFDLCENCASSIGLKRRGRKPNTNQVADNATGETPKKRGPGRPRKIREPEAQHITAAQPEDDDDDWETPAPMVAN